MFHLCSFVARINLRTFLAQNLNLRTFLSSGKSCTQKSALRKVFNFSASAVSTHLRVLYVPVSSNVHVLYVAVSSDANVLYVPVSSNVRASLQCVDTVSLTTLRGALARCVDTVEKNNFVGAAQHLEAQNWRKKERKEKNIFIGTALGLLPFKTIFLQYVFQLNKDIGE